MAQGKDITKGEFHKIMRDLKDGFGSVQQIADKHQVSPESVRAIRRAKTWPGFQAAKEARRVKNVQAPKKAVVASKDDQLQQELNMTPNEPLTPAHVQELLDSQQEVNLSNQNIVATLDVLRTAVVAMQRQAIKLDRRRWWRR